MYILLIILISFIQNIISITEETFEGITLKNNSASSNENFNRRFLKSDESNTKKRLIYIIGDSLVQVPNAMFKMTNLLKNQLIEGLSANNKDEEFEIDIQLIGGASNTIATLLKVMEEKISIMKKDDDVMPDVVIIYSDTDMSDLGYSGVPKNYKGDLVDLITLLKYHINHVALVGPTFRTKAGETPEHWKTDTTIVEFIEVNKAVCDKLGVHYINTRKAFQRVIRSEMKRGVTPKEILTFSWAKLKSKGIESTKKDQGILTFDGVHTNEKGTKVLVGLLAKEVLSWKDVWN